MEDDDTMDAYFYMTGDIGLFAQHTNSCGREFLEDHTVLLQNLPEDAALIVNNFCSTGTPGLPTCGALADNESTVLDANACAALIAFVDDLHVSISQPSRIDISHGKHDEQVRISQLELQQLVGAEQVQRLLCLYHSPVHSITIRRVTATAHSHLIAFHTDTGSSKTMQIALNPEYEYEGGRLVYATTNGFLRPARPPGSYTIHEWNMPHGVTALRRGVRYR